LLDFSLRRERQRSKTVCRVLGFTSYFAKSCPSN